MIDNAALLRIVECLDREDQAVEAVLLLLYGRLPDWIPDPSIDRARRTVQKLLNDGFQPEQIDNLVAEAEQNKLSFPCIVTDPGAFAQAVYELAHMRYAISLGKAEGLRCLAGEQARHGQAFKDKEYRTPGTGGPIRKWIKRQLAKNPTLKNRELWASFKKKPLRGWTVMENREGKYLEGPRGDDNMGYGRFSNVAKEERDKLKG